MRCSIEAEFLGKACDLMIAKGVKILNLKISLAIKHPNALNVSFEFFQNSREVMDPKRARVELATVFRALG